MLKLGLFWSFVLLSQAETTLGPGSSLVITQVSPVQSFAVRPETGLGEHWYVEVDFGTSKLPEPTILSGSWSALSTVEEIKTAEYVDYTGWYQHKSLHHLSLPIFNFTDDDIPFQLAIYLNLTPECSKADYSLTIRASETPLCAGNCSGHGVCRAGQCKCKDGYGDEICDLAVLDLKQSQSLIVTSGQVWYLQATAESLQDGKVVFEWTDGFPSIMTKNRGCEQLTALPSIYEHSDWYISSTSQGTYAVQSTADCSVQGTWTFRVAQSTNDPVVLFVRISQESSGQGIDIMVIVIGVVGSLVGVAWIAFITWKIYSRCNRRNVVVADLNSASQLKMRNLCPKQRFSSLLAPTQHPCPICLDEFTPRSDVRVLPCGHIYHELCIDQWFLRNQNCCLCKMDIFHPKESPEMPINETTFSIVGID
jgi:hypothetical protein